jgi:hypothetical protein
MSLPGDLGMLGGLFIPLNALRQDCYRHHIDQWGLDRTWTGGRIFLIAAGVSYVLNGSR